VAEEPLGSEQGREPRDDLSPLDHELMDSLSPFRMGIFVFSYRTCDLMIAYRSYGG